MGTDIGVTSGAIATVLEFAAREHPREACGLLLGRAGVIERAQPCANVAADPLRHFEIDPAALIAAHRAERAGGEALIGYWHSHPEGHPLPSATDCEHASGDGRVWAIAAAGEVTFWRDGPGGFEALSTRVSGM
ncbi:M67 family metallopeptidase [Novosphingobium sp.]|uniref:M67 family metallopeptidase n=1 Tax=Novosphingobium sp. TaxID=1874826 RepID=UPI00286DB147|nr:M67 family metallopeptidase [Novosphingobium sp.]